MKICIMMIVIFTLACNSVIDKKLELIIPDDFNGPIIIIVDPQGEEVSQLSQIARFQLPQCGVLRIRSDSPFREMRTWNVRRENGEHILNSGELEELSSDGKVALRGGGWGSTTRDGESSGERGTYFIGTAKEYEAFDFSTFPTPSCDQ